LEGVAVGFVALLALALLFGVLACYCAVRGVMEKLKHN